MAVNFVIPLLIPLEEDLINATRLFSENLPTDLQFENRQYCVVLSEDAPIGSSVVTVQAKQKEGLTVRYSITGGNRDGLFTIDKWTGAISIAAPLDREIQQEHEALIYEHELVVAGESGGQATHTLVRVAVADVNDNPPEFLDPNAIVTVIEEDDKDLPNVLVRAEAMDPDWVDRQGLLYTAEGEGIDGYSARDAYFSINPKTGELIQHRPLDRDPPNGKSVWKIKVKVHDGQFDWSSLRNYHHGYSVPLRHRGSNGVGRGGDGDLKNSDENGVTNGRHTGRRKHRKARHNYKNSYPKDEDTDGDNDRIAPPTSGIAPYLTPKKTGDKFNDAIINPLTTSASDISGDTPPKRVILFRTKRAESNPKNAESDGTEIDNFCLIKICENKTLINSSRIKFNKSDDSDIKAESSYFILNKVKTENATTLCESVKNNSEVLLVTNDAVWEQLLQLNNVAKKAELCPHLLKHYSFRESVKSLDSIKILMNNNEQNNDVNKEINRKSNLNFGKNSSVTSQKINVPSDFNLICDNNLKLVLCHDDLRQIIGCCRLREDVETTNKAAESLSILLIKKDSSPKMREKGLNNSYTVSDSSVLNPIHDIKQSHSNEINDQKSPISEASLYVGALISDLNSEHQDTKWSHEKISARSQTSNEEVTKSIKRRFPPEKIEKINASNIFLESSALKNSRKSFDLHNDSINSFQLTRSVSNLFPESVKAEVVRWNDVIKKIKSKSNLAINKTTKPKKVRTRNNGKFDDKGTFREENLDVSETENVPKRFRKFSNEPEFQPLINSGTKFNNGNNFFPKGFGGLHLSANEQRSQQRIPNTPTKSLAQNSESKSDPFERFKSNPLSNFIFLTNSKMNFFPPIGNNEEGRVADKDESRIYNNQEGRVGNKEERGNKQQIKEERARETTLNGFNSNKNNQTRPPNLRRLKTIKQRVHRRIKRHEPSPESFVMDRGGCLQFDSFSKNVQSSPDSTNARGRSGSDLLSIHDAQLRHMASQIMKSHGHRRRGNVHVAETLITIIVKDINDNAPIFPNATIFGEVQENGPIDLRVATVEAWDADDDSSGTNARLTYSIEKNVVDEKTGQALFAVNPRSGELRTALCCLDRETTPEYRLQVVASDGGGLKGTGTVVVRLADVNDNSPKLSKKEWNLTIDETPGTEIPSNKTILEITVTDPDTSNYFFYKVVEASGWGWDLFGIRTVGSVGELYALKPLDCEDETHKKGFRFLVEITDKGRGGWSDPRHVDGTWVSIHLRDVNDNPPVFQRSLVRLNVREDIPPGTLITTMKAEDPDLTDGGHVDYRLVDMWSRLKVEPNGGIKVRLPLDREGPEGSTFTVKIIAVDRGTPPLSSTATLSVTLNDVNDCPPRLLPPVVLHVKENTPPQMIGTLFATDDDVWSLGHGPPFNITIAPSNSEDVRRKIALKFKKELDSGRGGAEIWTLISLDREESRQLTVDITLSDAAKLIRTQPIVIIVDDVNDNMMQPGSKTVHLWKTRDSRSEAPLGRVYVDDPDDWDVDDKTFSWEGKPHPLFSLNPDFGTIFASGQIREGRYNLRFTVADRVWRQKAVKANVSVTVRLLSPEALIHAIPLTLSPTSPATLTKDWSPATGGGGLGYLTTFIQSVLGDVASKVEVVSLYGTNSDTDPPSSQSSSFFYSYFDDTDDPYVSDYFALPTACVWISVMDQRQKFINSVKLKGLLQMKIKQLEALANLRISTEEPFGHTSLSAGMPLSSSSSYSPSSPSSVPSHIPSISPSSPALSLPPTGPSSEYPVPHLFLNPSSAASLAPTSLPLQLVDSNTTSLVTPVLLTALQCPPTEPPLGHLEQCTDVSCYNGGRCIPAENKRRCVCPGNTWGPQCKIRTRSFNGSSWAWLSPLPRCSPLKIELRILTRLPEGLILYSGPLTSSFRRKSTLKKHQRASPYIALQIQSGKVSLLVEGSEGAIRLQTGKTGVITDGKWHNIAVVISEKGASLMLDMCATTSASFSDCYSSSLWPLPWKGGRWGGTSPLQIGGLAHNPMNKEDHGWEFQPLSNGFEGCLSELRIAGEEIDLGELAYNHKSAPGCPRFEKSCGDGLVPCGIRGTCSANDTCSCVTGWMGEKCELESTPATLREGSFAKVALSFIPDPFDTSIQFKFRTRRTNVSLLSLYAAQHPVALNIFISEGVLCFSLTSKSTLNDSSESSKPTPELRPTTDSSGGISTPSDDNDPSNGTIISTADSKASKNDNYFIPESSICVNGVPVVDGSWHFAKGVRRGHNLVLEVDDGNLWRRNSSLESLWKWQQEELEEVQKRNLQLAQLKESNINGRVTVVIGGVTPTKEVELELHQDSWQEITCIDDVRVSDHPLPLPPTSNGSRWGQVTMMSGLEGGCVSSNVCEGIVCNLPYVCKDNWLKSSCGCPANYQATSQGCQKLDLCLYNPCLNSGTCVPHPDGSFSCECPPKYIGKSCEWNKQEEMVHPFTTSLALLGAVASLLLIALILVGLLCFVCRYRGSGRKEKEEDQNEENQEKIEKKDRWKRAYFTDRSGKMHSEVAEQIETSLGIISEMRDSQKGGKKMKNKEIETICLAKFNTKLSETELTKFISGGHENPGRMVALIPPDDLRAYAYEGDESSAGSLGSAISGLRQQFSQELEIIPLTPAFSEVIDLLQNLPEAEKSRFISKSSQSSLNEASRERNMWIGSEPRLRSSDQNSRTLPKKNTSGSYCCKCNNQPSGKEAKGCLCAVSMRRNSNPDTSAAMALDCPCLQGVSQTAVSSISKNISFNAIKSRVPLAFLPTNNQASTKL